MRSRAGAVVGSLVFLALAPGTVAGWVPYWITRWRLAAAPPGGFAVQFAGALLIAAGAAVLLDCFARFALQGIGTPAPVLPTRRLVVTGWYRFVRNPMYVAVLAIVFGQVLLFGSRELLVYWLALAAGFHLFVVAFEEPTERRRRGTEYDRYRAAVRRWWPRLRPWTGE
jgi:protein-S-isoprenylcysteine O-methyltransferase Ste14